MHHSLSMSRGDQRRTWASSHNLPPDGRRSALLTCVLLAAIATTAHAWALSSPRASCRSRSLTISPAFSAACCCAISSSWTFSGMPASQRKRSPSSDGRVGSPAMLRIGCVAFLSSS